MSLPAPVVGALTVADPETSENAPPRASSPYMGSVEPSESLFAIESQFSGFGLIACLRKAEESFETLKVPPKGQDIVCDSYADRILMLSWEMLSCQVHKAEFGGWIGDSRRSAASGIAGLRPVVGILLSSASYPRYKDNICKEVFAI